MGTITRVLPVCVQFRTDELSVRVLDGFSSANRLGDAGVRRFDEVGRHLVG